MKITNTNYQARPSVTFTFKVTIVCVVTEFAVVTAVSNFNFVLNSTPVIKGPYSTYQIAECNYPVTYTVQRYQNNVLQAPNPNNFDSVNMQYTFSFTDPAQIDTVQKFVLTATINPGGVPMTATATVSIFILPDCSNTKLVDRAISNMSVLVSQTTTQNIYFADTTSDFFANPNYCGGSTVRVFTWTPAQPSFLQVSADKSVLTLFTTDPTKASPTPYTYTIVISLASPLTSVPSLTKTFQVTITCEVLSLSFPTISQITVEPGVTVQPKLQAFTTV